MALHFSRVALVGKYQEASGAAAADAMRGPILQIGQFLQRQGCEVHLHAPTANAAGLDCFPILEVAQIGTHCDLCVVVGGDGTMLGVGRQLAQYATPLIGINQGRLGFITDIPLDQYQFVLPDMLQGRFEEDERVLMLGRVMREGQCVFEAPAMNDVVVNRGSTSGMVELRVEVEGHFVATYRADGIIVATPTGSTAYSLSAGGPIVHPALPGLSLVPISPHTLSNRPIVLPYPSRLSIEIVGGRETNANFDMQSVTSLRHGDCIDVSCAGHCARFLHPQGWNYFDTLREKLHWNRGAG